MKEGFEVEDVRLHCNREVENTTTGILSHKAHHVNAREEVVRIWRKVFSYREVLPLVDY